MLAETDVERLRTIHREAPSSIRERARLVERDIQQMYDNLDELATYGLEYGLLREEDGETCPDSLCPDDKPELDESIDKNESLYVTVFTEGAFKSDILTV